MANEVMGKKLRFMSQDKFETITEADDELYAVNGSGIGFPSSRYEDLILGANGTEYVAPANGYFLIDKATTGNQHVNFENITRNFRITNQPYGTGVTIGILLPAQKGDIVKLYYSAAGTTNAFRFIYAEGE